MQNSTDVLDDLSDEEWEVVKQMFHEHYAKFGGLWTSMLSKEKSASTTVATPRQPTQHINDSGKRSVPRQSFPATSSTSSHGDSPGERRVTTDADYDAPSPPTSRERRQGKSERDRSLVDSKSPMFRHRADHDSYDEDDDEDVGPGDSSWRGGRPPPTSPSSFVDLEEGGGAGGSRDRDENDRIDNQTEYDDVNLCFQQLQMGEQEPDSGDDDGAGGDADAAASGALAVHDDDNAERRDSDLGSESLGSSEESIVADASPGSSNASATSSDVSGESTVLCFDHLDFDNPKRVSHVTKVNLAPLNVTAEIPDSSATLHDQVGTQQTPVNSREETSSNGSDPRRPSHLFATPNVTLRSSRRRQRRHHELREQCDCEQGNGGARATSRSTGSHTGSSSSGNMGPFWASDLVCQPCATSSDDDVKLGKTGSFTDAAAVQAEAAHAGRRDQRAVDSLGLGPMEASSPHSQGSRGSPGGVLAALLDWSDEQMTDDPDHPVDKDLEDASVREDESRHSVPHFVSMSRSVDTIMSPMNDSTWTVNATVAASSFSRGDRPTRTPITLAKPKRIPTSILRPTAETVLSPLASMTPYLRPVSQAARRATSPSTELSSTTSSSSSDQRRSDEPARAVAGTTMRSDYGSNDDSDDDIPFQGANQRSQLKTKSCLRRVMLDDSDESTSKGGEAFSVAVESPTEAADYASQRYYDGTPSLGTVNIDELAKTMNGIRIKAPPTLSHENKTSTDESSGTRSEGSSQGGAATALPPAQSKRRKQQNSGSDSTTSYDSKYSSSRAGRNGWKLAVDSGFVDMTSPDPSTACKSPRIIDLLDSSSDGSDDSEVDVPARKLKRSGGPTPASNWKQSEHVIDLLSSSDSEEEDEIDIEYDDSRSHIRDPVCQPIPSKHGKTGEGVPQSSSSKIPFLRQREAMARQLFLEYDRLVFHGALSLGGACTLKWSKRLLTTAGLTKMPMNSKTATVVLSSKLIDRESRLKLTLMHELCHAAAWIIDGCSKLPHGKVFRKWGDRAERLVPGMKVANTHDYEIDYKYSWRCQNADCGRVYGRTKRTLDVNRHRCGECKSQLVETVKPGTPAKPKAPPSEYQRFVQEHSASVRRQLEAEAANVLRPSGFAANQPSFPSAKKVSQSDVLKECARLWQARKVSSTPR